MMGAATQPRGARWLACIVALGPQVAAADVGRVVYATAESTFLDRGSRDGLREGEIIELARAGHIVATCTLARVSAHSARCSRVERALGLTFRVAEPMPPAPPRTLPPPYKARTQARLQAALADAPRGAVSLRPRATARLRRRTRAAWAALGHDNWLLFGGNARHIERERLDVGIVGASLALGTPWQASLQLTALGFTARDAAVHFRPSAPAMLYVKQLQVDNLRQAAGLQVAAGRVNPAFVPGLALLDGAQLGYARPGGDAHVGAYAGFLPLLATLAPNVQRFTVGGYGAFVRRPWPGAVLQQQARLAFVGLPGGESRLEVEGTLDWRHRHKFSLSAGPRLGLLTRGGKVRLEALRADLAVDPSRFVHLYSGVRLATADYDAVVGLGAFATGFRTTVHSFSALTIQPLAWLALSGQNAVAWDRATGTLHVLSGPELGLPRLFGARGGASVAWLQENKHARSLYVQGRLAILPTWSVSVRTTYFEDVFQTDNLLREMSLFVGSRSQLTRWLSLEVSVLGRHGLHNARIVTDAPYSLRSSIRLTGRL